MNQLNQVIAGSKDKSILLDVFLNAKQEKKPIVIFCHGYKGFKDWGAWNTMSEQIASTGFNVVKFNFSHNGTTINNPLDFDDLEAFGNNNYCLELDDLGCVIDWVCNNVDYDEYFDKNEIYLIGHSRGGGIVLLKSNEDKRIKKVVTWAGVSDYFKRIPTGEKFDNWKKEGVLFEKNGRTHQNMPVYYQFFESMEANKQRLNIQQAVSFLSIPLLVLHGSDDQVVKLKEAENLISWNTKAQLTIIENTAHTFDSKHPFVAKEIPKALKEVVGHTLDFFNPNK